MSMAAASSSAPSAATSAATNGPDGFASRYVVAIDFGTSHSGFAFAQRSEKVITGFYQWTDQPVQYAKTLSAILYKGHDAVSWGYNARRMYSAMKPEERKNAQYIDRFKLLLDEEYVKQNPDKAKGKNAVVLIGDYLRFMLETVRTTLQLKYGDGFRLADVQWCLTVPAMWSDKGKAHTRKAAVFAGMIAEPNDPRLSIILEPEAAALYVALEDANRLKDKDVFMILDAGGGTVDLTVHQVARSPDGTFQFAEVVPGSGKSCGSTFVDDAFLNLVRSRLGADAVERAQAERPEAMVNLLTSWENTKRTFKNAPDEDRYAVALSGRLLNMVSDENKERLADLQDGEDDSIILTNEDMRGVFEKVLGEIDSLVDEMIDSCKAKNVTIDKILCVGGFNSSAYLVQHVRSRYEPQGHLVFCPNDPGAVVVKGAVHYGLNPDAITARRARLTYGLAVRGYWDSSYPEEKRSWDHYQRTWMIEDKFDILIKHGEGVDVNKVVKRTYYPPAIWSKSIKLSMYATKAERPQFVDQEGCFQLGEITVPLILDENRSINDYPIEISVHFGATEISIKARNPNTDELYDAAVSYTNGIAEEGQDQEAVDRDSESSTSSVTKRARGAADSTVDAADGGAKRARRG
ncbi:hypothetical protein BC828DRAFT_381721 [Blastocladiella britannica]|nr:hypothetical protein BC828DRAFT_381721 [Blastocladiella britannica]